jgi:hypothetical protein
MQQQSWVLGHLEWLIGAVVLLPVGYLGKWLFNRWTPKRALAPGPMNLTPSFSGMSPGETSSLPSADDLQDAYGLLPICYRADLLRNYVGLNVRWPGILVGAHARPEAPGYAYVHFRFDGERTNGAFFRCQVKVADYPAINAAKEGEAKAWVQGKIAGIEDACITLSKSIVEFQ